MKKILVSSIRFTTDGRNMMDMKDGSRALVVGLNNGKNVTIDLDGAIVRYCANERPWTLTATELEVSRLVYLACWNYLNGDEPESLDYGAVVDIENLAENRIDWEGAGYGPEVEEGERAFHLADLIAHYDNF